MPDTFFPMPQSASVLRVTQDEQGSVTEVCARRECILTFKAGPIKGHTTVFAYDGRDGPLTEDSEPLCCFGLVGMLS